MRRCGACVFYISAALLQRTDARQPPPVRTHDSPFLQWSDTLYCAGVEENLCPLANGSRSLPGQCHWHRRNRFGNYVPVTQADMNTTKRQTFAQHQWNPPVESGYRYFNRQAAAACVQGKRLLVAGDSTSRDTYYMLGLVAGYGGAFFRRVSSNSADYWPDGAWMPKSNLNLLDHDRQGRCMGHYEKKQRCVRDHEFPNPLGVEAPSTRLSFQFLMSSNASWELDDARRMLGERPADFAFVQCPMYEWFKPDAYNYSLSRAERARVIKVSRTHKTGLGERFLKGIGVACSSFIEKTIERVSPRTKVYHLGIASMPGWAHEVGGKNIERHISHSIHTALGLGCRKRAGGAEYVHTSNGRIVSSIDRLSLCGPRTRDGIHPRGNTQFAVVQMMLNHMCPAGLGETSSVGDKSASYY